MAATPNEGYATWRLLIELNNDDLQELLELDAFDWATQYNALFDAASPRCSGVRVHPNFPKHSSILYIEAGEKLCGGDRDVVRVARNAAGFLGQEGTVAQPHLLRNIVVTQDIGLGVPKYKVAAVRLELVPEEKKRSVILIPSDVWRIGSCLAYILQLRHTSERLKDLSFYRLTLTDYVGRLERADSILRSHEGVFLADREEELTLRPHIQRLAGELRREVVVRYLSCRGYVS